MKQALLAALVLALSACGPTQTAESASTRGFNPADVMFLQMMVPHHEQGLQIVRLAKDRPVRAEVRMLTAAIEATQTQELETMAGWLRSWGAPPSADPDDHAAHGGMPGTTEAEMAVVAKAPDAEFERKFLDLLIGHQDDARQMALQEKAGGINGEARQLADSIDRSREAQVKQLLSYR